MFKKVLIMFNPNAGKGKGIFHAKKIENSLKKHNIEIEMFESHSIQASHDFFKAMKKPTPYDCVIIIGGDGTLGPTIEGMIKAGHDIPIYAYGKGTANDVASYYGTLTKNMKHFEEIFLAGKTTRANTLEVNGRLAVNVSCGGVFTNGVTKYKSKLKKLLGKTAYISKALVTALSLRAQRVDFEVDGVFYSCKTYLFMIVNTKNAGSLKSVASIAGHNDDLLDLIIIKKTGFWGKVEMCLRILNKKAHRDKHIIYVQGKHFTVTPAEPVIKTFTLSDIDGNPGPEYPLEVKLGENKVTFVTNE